MKRLVFAVLMITTLIFSGICLSGCFAPMAEPDDLIIEETEVTLDEILRAELKEDIDKGYLILVNKEHSLDKEYEPQDLTETIYFAKDRSPLWRKMREEAATAFHRLSEDAKAEGLEIVVTTCYRSYDFQSQLYYGYVNTKGQEWADKYSAKPGTSEHQTGLAADCSSPSVNYQLTVDFENTEEGKWLSENAYKYGFVIRYEKGKEEITGYSYEPWHIRYVGEKAAKVTKEKNFALEELIEYLDIK